ncbi:MAG: 5-formyltetrahydrofolate cyclo-ligase [Deltaproteobacteria bacterium]|nr:5-formyltetrahydrofolate cyclo-ligase [Deltaproteobacteria bacterium]
MDKSAMRSSFLTKRTQLNPQRVSQGSLQICEHLLGFILEQATSQVCLFKSIKNEPRLEFLAEILFERLPLGLPVVLSDKEMEFHRWKRNDVLKTNKWGIPEPSPRRAPKMVPDERTVVVIPCLAVDKKGIRLGFGKGYYDIYLAKYPQVVSIAVAFDEFIVDELPLDDWDKPVQWIGSEKGLLKPSRE